VKVFTAVTIQAFALKFILQRAISNAIFLATSYVGYMQLLIFPAVLLLPSIRCLRLLVVMIMASISFTLGVVLYYWAAGYRRLVVPGCPDTQAFFFSKVDAYGWFRW
jgi:hypothetical protein